jgi:type II secretory pathway component PulF
MMMVEFIVFITIYYYMFIVDFGFKEIFAGRNKTLESLNSIINKSNKKLKEGFIICVIIIIIIIIIYRIES